MTNLTLNDLLNNKFLTEFKKISKEFNVDIHPVAFILMCEPISKTKGKIEPIILGHLSKDSLINKKLNVEVQNNKLLNSVIKSLKRI